MRSVPCRQRQQQRLAHWSLRVTVWAVADVELGLWSCLRRVVWPPRSRLVHIAPRIRIYGCWRNVFQHSRVQSSVHGMGHFYPALHHVRINNFRLKFERASDLHRLQVDVDVVRVIAVRLVHIHRLAVQFLQLASAGVLVPVVWLWCHPLRPRVWLWCCPMHGGSADSANVGTDAGTSNASTHTGTHTGANEQPNHV